MEKLHNEKSGVTHTELNEEEEPPSTKCFISEEQILREYIQDRLDRDKTSLSPHSLEFIKQYFPEVMKWLSRNGISLNVCPESNISLKRVKSYKTHPIRILFDHGVNVTVNTDDVMLFNAGNSEQYLKLYKSGLFSAEDLDVIRMNGLRNAKGS